MLIELWNQFIVGFLSLGANYGVNPWIFGAIYVGAIPFFMLSVAWIVRNYRAGRSVVLPVFCASCCFVSAYVYLIIVGEHVPTRVYVFVVGLLVFGAWSTWKKIEKKIKN